MHESSLLEMAPIRTRADRPTPRVMARLIGLASLLAAECLLLTLAYNTSVFEGDDSPQAMFLRQSRSAAQLVVAVGIATLVLGGRTLKSELDRLCSSPDPARRSWAYLAGHVAAYATFVGLTASIWEGAGGTSPIAFGAVVAWVFSGLATVVLWAMTALPAASWLVLGRRMSGVLALGLLVGFGAISMGRWTKSLWTSFHHSTFWGVEHLLRLAFSGVVCEPEQMAVGVSAGDRPFVVTIAPECSGYEGIGLIWALLLGSFWLFRRQFRFPRAFLLLPIGTALMWAANIVRIAGLVSLGALISPKIALGGAHSQAGWIAFNLVGLGLIAGAQRSRFFAGRPVENDETSARTAPSPSAAYLVPLLALVGSSMVTAIFTDGFDRLYPARMAVVLAVLACYRREYAPARPVWSWSPVTIGVVVFVLWMALEPAAASQQAGFDPRRELPIAWASAWLAARVIGSVLIVPLVEELAFRGYLMRRLVSADFAGISPRLVGWMPLAVSSLAFGALHGRWLAGTLAGVCYGLAYRHRGRLGDAVVSHATTNALIAAYVVSTESWFLWS